MYFEIKILVARIGKGEEARGKKLEIVVTPGQFGKFDETRSI